MTNETLSIVREIVIPLASIVAILAPPIIIHRTTYKRDQTIKAMEEKIRLLTENPLTLKNGIYYDKEGWPFCPVCYGKDGRKIPFQKQGTWYNPAARCEMPPCLHCHGCGYEIDDTEE